MSLGRCSSTHQSWFRFFSSFIWTKWIPAHTSMKYIHFFGRKQTLTCRDNFQVSEIYIYVQTLSALDILLQDHFYLSPDDIYAMVEHQDWKMKQRRKEWNEQFWLRNINSNSITKQKLWKNGPSLLSVVNMHLNRPVWRLLHGVNMQFEAGW